jgi:hypothetical protein
MVGCDAADATEDESLPPSVVVVLTAGYSPAVFPIP